MIALDFIFKLVMMGSVKNSLSDRRVNRMSEKDRLRSYKYSRTLLRLPTVQSYLTVNRWIKGSRFSSETLKSASLACIVLRSS